MSAKRSTNVKQMNHADRALESAMDGAKAALRVSSSDASPMINAVRALSGALRGLEHDSPERDREAQHQRLKSGLGNVLSHARVGAISAQETLRELDDAALAALEQSSAADLLRSALKAQPSTAGIRLLPDDPAGAHAGWFLTKAGIRERYLSREGGEASPSHYYRRVGSLGHERLTELQDALQGMVLDQACGIGPPLCHAQMSLADRIRAATCYLDKA